MIPRIKIYGSGDHGTKELLAKCFARNIDIEYHDVRNPNLLDIRFLMERNMTTVPRSFTIKNEYIGEFYETLEWITQTESAQA